MRNDAKPLRKAATAPLRRLRNSSAVAWIGAPVRAALAKLAHYGPKSLANRILLLQLLWTFFIYILVITALWVSASLVIESSIRHQGENWIAKLDELGIPIYASNKPAQLKYALSSLHNFPGVAQVQYLDEHGKKTIAEYTRKDAVIVKFAPLGGDAIKKLGRVDVEQKTLLFEKEGNAQMRISAPIWVKSISSDGMIDYGLNKPSEEKVQTIGFIELVLDYSNTTNNLNRNIFYASLAIAFMMLMASFVVRVMVHRALKPLSELEEPLTRLASGETDITVNTSGDQEIARIGVALNTTIGALRERDEALRQMADHDALTGLPNRRLLTDRMKQAIAQIQRSGKILAVCYIDLDGFKQVNDQYGHAAGDRLLVEITHRLQDTIRAGDTLARMGGDEFVVLLPDLAGETECFSILNRILDKTAAPVFIDGDKIAHVSASIGVAFCATDDADWDTLLRHADQAMYVAKQTGKSRYHRFEYVA